MNVSPKPLLLVLIIGSLASGVNAIGRTKPQTATLKPVSLKNPQRLFGMEYPVKRKSHLPVSIWKKLIAGEDNEATRDQVLAQNDPDIWVETSQIDLNNDNRPDYIVIATNGNWLGANITAFWLFLNEKGRYRLVLRLSALQLEFSKGMRNGFRTITTGSLTAVDFCETNYKYNGRKYIRSPHPGQAE